MGSFFRIFKFAGSLWKYYLSISIFTIILGATTLLQPVITGQMVDVLSNDNIDRVRSVVVLVVLLFLMDAGSGIISNISGYLGDQMSAKLHKILAERYFAHLLTLPQSYYDQELSGKIIGRLNRGSQQISMFINMTANNFLQMIVATVLALVLTIKYSWLVALELAIIYPIFSYMTIKTSAKWQQYQSERNAALDTASGRFSEAIGQIKVVKSFIQEKRELKFFDKYMSRFVDRGRPQSRLWHQRDVERRFVLAVIFLVVYLTIFVQAAKGLLTGGEAVTLMLLAYQMRMPIFSISFLVDNTQRAIADSKDYFEVIETKSDIVDRLNATKLEVDKAEISFRDVSFGYNQDKPVLNDLSFKIEPGSKVALVGESGEGKTTITNLLMRLYDATSGQILIDGQDIADVTQASLRASIGVVFQEPALFSGTIRENIAYSSVHATDEQIIAAAKSANAHDFISGFENGYDTEIGERGLKLSGGQKQRIAIARALLKDAPILVLDEATSSLDNKSELLVQEALNRLMKNRTTLIIAHRLSTIQHVDTIITLKNGRIDEIGSPRQLSRTKGIYARLLALSKNKNSEQIKKTLQEFDLKV